MHTQQRPREYAAETFHMEANQGFLKKGNSFRSLHMNYRLKSTPPKLATFYIINEPRRAVYFAVQILR
jgi:hypothetical protein